MCAIEITIGPDTPRRSAIQDTELTYDGKENAGMEPEKNCNTCGCYCNPINTAPRWSQATYPSEKRTVSCAKINALEHHHAIGVCWRTPLFCTMSGTADALVTFLS
jgi:hypothetical protein